MLRIYNLVLGLMLLNVVGCQQSEDESQRGKSQLAFVNARKSSNQEAKGENPAPATQDPKPAIDTVPVPTAPQPVTFESDTLAPLKLMSEADQTALPAGFMDDIFAMHKISASKTLLFGKSKQSWLLDESKDGVISKLTLDFTPPQGSQIYILENKNFWLVSKTSVTFPSTQKTGDQGQLVLINLNPELFKDPASVNKILFAGPERLIIANDTKANIIVLEGDKARMIALDFPKIDGAPLAMSSAGLMKATDAYWFASKDRLLFLKKGGDGMWRWFINKYKLETVEGEATSQIAMLIDQADDGSVSYLGRTFELASSKIYEQNTLKLSLEDSSNPSVDPVFTSDIQPLLKASCVSCHLGYDSFATVKSKASAYKTMIGNGSMPKGSSLTPAQIKTLSDYMAKLIAVP